AKDARGSERGFTAMNTQTEQIRAGIENFTGIPVTDEEIENIARTTPALFHLVSELAQGRLADARTVTDKFLRTLPEDLFDYLLVGALAFFRRGDQMDIETLLNTEMCGIAARLWTEESGEAAAARDRTDDECYALVERF